jgi:hypothetical protein
MGMHLTDESEALHDTVIQVYKFSFGPMIYADALHSRLPARCPAPVLLDGASF